MSQVQDLSGFEGINTPMKIVQIRQLTGPGIWSVNLSKLIVLQLASEIPPGACSFEATEQAFRKNLPGINIPFLDDDINKDDFKQGKWLAGCVEATAVYLLSEAGATCEFSECRPYKKKGSFSYTVYL